MSNLVQIRIMDKEKVANLAAEAEVKSTNLSLDQEVKVSDTNPISEVTSVKVSTEEMSHPEVKQAVIQVERIDVEKVNITPVKIRLEAEKVDFDEDKSLTEDEDDPLNNGSVETDQTTLDDEDEDELEMEEEKVEESDLTGFAAAKARGDVDQWVRYLDETDPSHRLRSLCKRGDVEALTSLLESNDPEVDLNAVSEEGWTSLHEIITHECQFTEVARILLKFGANVNTRDLHGDSPLHSALLYHNADNILLLLRHGADLEMQNNGGRMPIHVADEVETLKLVLQNGGKPDAQDRVGNTALHYATVSKDKERISLLLDSGADVNVQNKAGSAPLHLVSDSEVSGMLINKGADPNLSDVNGNTPLHLAVRGRHKEIVKMFLDNKADSSKVNNNGKTPLQLAKDKEMKNILQGKITSSSSSSSSERAASPAIRKKICKRQVDLETLTATVAPKCLSPGILKRKRELENGEETPSRKGPRLRFSDVNDYSGVEEVEEAGRRVKVTPIYSEINFSSDED